MNKEKYEAALKFLAQMTGNIPCNRDTHIAMSNALGTLQDLVNDHFSKLEQTKGQNEK
jgi:hypothetical protein